jgi:hypothetical protein
MASPVVRLRPAPTACVSDAMLRGDGWLFGARKFIQISIKGRWHASRGGSKEQSAAKQESLASVLTFLSSGNGSQLPIRNFPGL